MKLNFILNMQCKPMQLDQYYSVLIIRTNISVNVYMENIFSLLYKAIFIL